MLLKARDQDQAQFSEAPNFGAQQTYRFARLLIVGDLGIVLVGHAEIMTEDMTLLDVEPEVVKIIG